MRVPATQDSRAYAMLGHALSSPVALATAVASSGEELPLVQTLPHGTQPTYGRGSGRLDHTRLVRGGVSYKHQPLGVTKLGVLTTQA